MIHTAALRVLPAIALTALMAACSNTPPASTAPVSTPTPSAVQPGNTATLLPAYYWDLRSAYDARGQQSGDWRITGHKPVRLVFHERGLGVQNLCNVVNAGYRLTGSNISIERPVSTLRACPEAGLMALERRVLEKLPQAQRIDLRPASGSAAPVLVLFFNGGERWEFAGTPTPATRYGSAGERVFLEVAPQRVPCNHPQMRDAQCLRVRDISFNEQGIRTGAGEWRVFQGEIEGFTHQPGIRNVLRVQRYSLARDGRLPAGAASHAYVLDMVVESEKTR